MTSLGEHVVLSRKCLSDLETEVPFPEIIYPLKSPRFNESEKEKLSKMGLGSPSQT